jgi:hypothetical protein
MCILAIQFLEYTSLVQDLTRDDVVRKLHRAGQLLPITHVLIGWQLPEALEEACHKETECMGAKFYRWQPYLTSDNAVISEPDWQVENALGHKVKGFQNLPEFTLICPNNSAAMDEKLKHLETIVKTGIYDGIFLDRIRYPSASQEFPNDLGCFCEHCIRSAKKVGLELDDARQEILQTKTDRKKGSELIEAIFSRRRVQDLSYRTILQSFFQFRVDNITRVVSDAARLIHGVGMEVGLDCFSPSLTTLVGQDLNHLGECADWVKIMTYARTFAPAGLPFEYRGLLDYLIRSLGLEEKSALLRLKELSGIPLPSDRQEFESEGFSAIVLEKEILRGARKTRAPTLAGIELVEDPNVIPLKEKDWENHLEAIKQACPAGLSLSWDLLKIADPTLISFSRIYEKLWK